MVSSTLRLALQLLFLFVLFLLALFALLFQSLLQLLLFLLALFPPLLLLLIHLLPFLLALLSPLFLVILLHFLFFAHYLFLFEIQVRYLLCYSFYCNRQMPTDQDFQNP
jgi:hypothetical protein